MITWMLSAPPSVNVVADAKLSDVRGYLQNTSNSLALALQQLKTARSAEVAARKALGKPAVDPPVPMVETTNPDGTKTFTQGVKPPGHLDTVDLQDMTNTYGAGVLMKQLVDDSLAGKRRLAYNDKGELLIGLTANDTVRPGLDAQGRPQIYEMSSDKVIGTELSTLGSPLAIVAWVAVALVTTICSYLWTDTSRTQARTAEKVADAQQECVKSGKTLDECTKGTKAAADAVATVTNAGEANNPITQVTKAVTAATTGITTIAVIGIAAYAGFMILNAMNQRQKALPQPAPAT